MPDSRSVGVLSILLSLALFACESGPGPSDQPSGPLYRCIGVPPYDQAFMDSFLIDLKKHPLVCKDGQAVQEGKAAKLSAAGAGSMRVHAYVMDSRCRFITEQQAVFPADRPISVPMVWTPKDAQGNQLPTGEYYVNVVADRGAAGKDTTYHKTGYIRNPCSP